MDDPTGEVVSFTRMDDGTREDFALLVRQSHGFIERQVAENVLDSLRVMENFSNGLQVSYLEHCLQTATRAYRDNARDDLIVASLLHDIGDVLAPANHGEVAAAIVEPYLDEEATWIVRHHPVFQGYHFWDKLDRDPNARDIWRNSPYFDATAYFCAEWDQTSFDPAFKSMTLEDFAPLVREVFARPVGYMKPDEPTVPAVE